MENSSRGELERCEIYDTVSRRHKGCNYILNSKCDAITNKIRRQMMMEEVSVLTSLAKKVLTFSFPGA